MIKVERRAHGELSPTLCAVGRAKREQRDLGAHVEAGPNQMPNSSADVERSIGIH
jgi:hypothetical protein